MEQENKELFAVDLYAIKEIEGLTPLAKLIFGDIYTMHRNSEIEKITVTNQYLARRNGATIRGVANAINQLKELGLIRVFVKSKEGGFTGGKIRFIYVQDEVVNALIENYWERAKNRDRNLSNTEKEWGKLVHISGLEHYGRAFENDKDYENYEP